MSYLPLRSRALAQIRRGELLKLELQKKRNSVNRIVSHEAEKLGRCSPFLLGRCRHGNRDHAGTTYGAGGDCRPLSRYRQLRDRSPFEFVWLPAGIMPGIETALRSWAFMRYDDVYGALRDHATFSSVPTPLVRKTMPPTVLLTDDPPRHTRFRRIVNKAFTATRIEGLTPWITGIANQLLDRLGSGETDVVEHYAIPLPVTVIARLLGIPGDEYEQFRRWSEASVSLPSMNDTERRRRIDEMMAYFGKMAAARRAQGAEDLITALVEAEVESEKLEEWEILGFCLLLLTAGNETDWANRR